MGATKASGAQTDGTGKEWLTSDFRVLGHHKAAQILVVLAERGRMTHKQVTKDLTDASTQSTVILQGLAAAGLAEKADDGWWSTTPRGKLVAGHCRAILDSASGAPRPARTAVRGGRPSSSG